MNGQIRTIRKARALSQSDLARQAGVHRTTISRIERGVGARPGIGRLERIASALSVPLASLVADKDISQIPSAITSLPSKQRLSLSEFLGELVAYLDGSPIATDLLPKDRWIEWCHWALDKLHNEER